MNGSISTKVKETFECFIQANVTNPNKEELAAILEIFQERSYDRGGVFKHHNEICKELAYIVDGSMRLYVVKENGEEMTGNIVSKDNMVTDFISVRANQKTPMSIEALEPTTLLVASTENHMNLLEVNLTYNQFIREHLADSAMKLAKLHMLFLTGSAKERYQFILESNPDLLKKFPLRFIATMIGISPTQLSRIRKNNLTH
ncbi:MAG: Crp/Fnr family transcriptional regulator [Bacteroidota bacterium]